MKIGNILIFTFIFIVLVATPSMAHSHDDNIESVAGNIHELAHLADRAAHDMRHDIEDENDFNKAEERMESLRGYIIDLGDPVHVLYSDVPASHAATADEIHDDLHDLQDEFQNFEAAFQAYKENPDDETLRDEWMDSRSDLRNLAQNIRDNAETIKDELGHETSHSDDGDIKSVAANIHELAHLADRAAHDMRHDIEDENDFNKAEERMESLRGYIIDLGDPIHVLYSDVPASHAATADEIHDDLHDMQDEFQNFEAAFQAYKENPDDETLSDEWMDSRSDLRNFAQNIRDNAETIKDELESEPAPEPEPEFEDIEESPGFETIFALAGVLAVALFARRK
ncbi:PGF-CTERM sorting domain-containing protein [Methanosalsum natronophilum]|uniref:PGF-CTERM sorting domain-containing protein n=1 Tax=Methanosalsum natronophilum TaxID=768733 RepID=UPI002166D67C|nr:PGF-CTERM sorting domain-containing protein [Methanosalsum natronophilum]MCS3923653.1 PGF-CTERM protein [Methanosalsum natronophilum]